MSREWPKYTSTLVVNRKLFDTINRSTDREWGYCRSVNENPQRIWNQFSTYAVALQEDLPDGVVVCLGGGSGRDFLGLVLL